MATSVDVGNLGEKIVAQKLGDVVFAIEDDIPQTPAFPFGYGLSYTTFSYDSLRILPPMMPPDGSAMVSFTVRNTGIVTGDEVAQLYVKELVSSRVTPDSALKGFQRVHLLPGESTEVSFPLSPVQLSNPDAKMECVVEPGEVRTLAGSSSRDIRH